MEAFLGVYSAVSSFKGCQPSKEYKHCAAFVQDRAVYVRLPQPGRSVECFSLYRAVSHLKI